MTLAVTTSRAIIAHHSKSFALASKLLPPEGRDEASIVYAWCRRADDAVDLVPEKEQGRAARALLHELDGIYAGDAPS
ncbi:MAG: squalene/phytoene synthase family protein, partial [Polyangiaceae bacterium]